MGTSIEVSNPTDGVALITLNRPAARNAVDANLAGELVEAIATAQDQRCIVITGADPAFSAGLDLRNLGTDRLDQLPNFLGAVRESGIPTIAAVNGPAVTGGFEIALGCDFIVGSERAKFADTHLRVGVYPGPVLVELPRRVGISKARELSLTGNFVDAAEALRIGLINHLVPHDELVPFALGLAADIAAHDPTMVATMRRDWDATSSLPIRDAHRKHYEFAREVTSSGATREHLQGRMGAVLETNHSRLS